MFATILRRVALAATLATTTAASAQQVEHTFVFVIDGVRASEGFDDPSHEFVQALYEEIAPEGSLLTYVEVRDQPETVPSHMTMMSGTYADFANFSPYEEREAFAQWEPTLFEAYRMQTGAPEESCWLVGNTPLIHDSSHSLMPGYGRDYGPSRALDYTGHEQNQFAWDHIADIMAENEVALMLVNLHETDRHAHAGSWLGYTEKTAESSDYIAAFWDQLQADPVYQDSTVVMVATDHGRHNEGVLSGWNDHGCSCSGCRQAFLLAIGPGIRAGFESDDAASTLDIAPTIAHLMDLDFPYHRGRILTEILMSGASVDQGPGGLGSFQPTATAAGDLVVRASELQDPDELDADGAHQVVVEISEDGGETWDETTTGDDDVLQYAPAVWTDGEVTLAAWLEIEAKGEEWSVRARRIGAESSDWEEVLFEAMEGSSTPISNVVFSQEGDDVYLMEMNARQETIRMWSSDDRGLSWSDTLFDYTVERYFPRDVDHVQAGDNLVVAYSVHAEGPPGLDDPNDNTEIYWMVSDDEGDSWSDENRLTDDEAPSIQPILRKTDDGVLHLVWADLEDGEFQLMWSDSTDDGETFSSPDTLTSASVGAWEPAAISDGERLYLAWSEFDDADEARIHYAALEDGELVEEQVLSDEDYVARAPTIAPLGDCTALVTWSQSDLDDGWELESAVVTTAGQPAAGATGSLSPDTLVTGGTALVQLTIDLAMDDESRGVDGIEIAVPSGLAAAGTADLTVDGEAAEATATVEGAALWLELTDPVTADGAQLLIGLDVDVQADPFSDAEFTVLLYDGQEPCPVTVEGAFAISADAGGDDDDDSAADDDDDDDCECSASGGGEGSALAALLGLGILVGIRRLRR